MNGEQLLQTLAQQDQLIDDCWNRIGVHGDKQCPLLVRHIHCRNCEVYAAAATRLLDRYALLDADELAPAPPPERVDGRSLLLFRLGEEWLALATACLAEVAPMQPVHSLPHQRSRVLQGVAMCAVHWCPAYRWPTCSRCRSRRPAQQSGVRCHACSSWMPRVGRW